MLESPLEVGLTGACSAMRPLDERDYEWLFEVETQSPMSHRWRHRGTAPSLDEFVHSLWQGITVQFIATDRRTGDPIGRVLAYEADFRNRHVAFGFYALPGVPTRGAMIEPAALFLNFLFRHYDFRKVYAEVIAYNLPQFNSCLRRGWTQDGCLGEHEYFDGRYWDINILSTTRELFYEHWGALVERIGAWGSCGPDV